MMRRCRRQIGTQNPADNSRGVLGSRVPGRDVMVVLQRGAGFSLRSQGLPCAPVAANGQAFAAGQMNTQGQSDNSRDVPAVAADGQLLAVRRASTQTRWMTCTMYRVAACRGENARLCLGAEQASCPQASGHPERSLCGQWSGVVTVQIIRRTKRITHVMSRQSYARARMRGCAAA